MPPHTTFHVAGSEVGKPLVEYLATRLSTSKKRAKQLLDDRVVFINRQRVWMARHEMRRGDLVEIQAVLEKPAATAVEPLPILYRDTDYVIVDKPPGLVSNGAQSAETRLRQQLDIRTIEAVHRIDRDTSGCLLFAATAKACEAMLPLFEDRTIRKTYRALVFGSFPREMRYIDEPIEGQLAKTLVRVLATQTEVSHLELAIETGRTHQIRKHLASVGFPVLGDKVYATKPVESDRLRGVQRQMLHALALEFEQPLTKKPIRAKAPIPSDFGSLASRLKLFA